MRILSAIVMLANGRGSWKLRAMPKRVRWCAIRPSTLRPSKRTAPVSLTSVPHRQLTSVLLPEPFGPIRPTRSPWRPTRSIAVERDEAAEPLSQTLNFEKICGHATSSLVSAADRVAPGRRFRSAR